MVVTPSVAQPVEATSAPEAWQALVGLPLPARRQEDWRFDDLTLLAERSPRLWSGDSPLASVALPAGVHVMTPAEAEPELARVLAQTGCDQHWPVCLNRAAKPAVLALRVSAATAADAAATAADAAAIALELNAGSAGELLAVQLLLVLEPGAELELVPHLIGEGAGVLSVVIAAVVGDKARLKVAAVAEGQHESVLLAHLPVLQESGSELAITSVSAGWGFSRLEPRVVQQSGAARTKLRGLQWAAGSGMADTHAMVRFEGPDGVLDQLHKVVADDAARSIFNGAVQVPRSAQRTDAAQLSRSLLLSDRARIDTKPELEIVADDVKCAHGATISQLQSEELFYLQSRGIAREQASRLLLQGYCNEILRELPAVAQAWGPLAAQLREA